ncbi:MAG: MFS transporter [Clostridia bacterium]|nr:MFS transporter [Clostridia bacterium]
MPSNLTTRQKYYPWVIMVSCCIFMGATIGIGTNCGSIFMPVLAEAFDVGLGTIATQSTIMCIAMAGSAPWVGRQLGKVDVRKMMTASAILTGTGFLLQGVVQNVWQYYLTGILLGFGIGMGSFMTITMIINNWFQKNRGVVIGITLSVSSVVGIIMNPVLNSIIDSHGWRVAASLKGVLVLVTLPLVWLFIRMRPEEKGCVAWGAGEVADIHEEKAEADRRKADSLTAREIFSSVPFLMMVIFSFLFAVCMCPSGHLQNIAISNGFTSAVGAMMVSAYMTGEFVGKLGLGWLNDKYGINRAVFMVTSIGMIGVLGLFFVGELGPTFGLICGLLFGPMTATTSVGYTLIANNTFGPSLYPRYYPYMSMASTIAFSVGSPMMGFLFDFTGSWNAAYCFVLCGLAVSMFLLNVSTKMMAKERADK